MAQRRREEVRAISAGERARRLGSRVDPPRDVDDEPSDGDPTGTRQDRWPRGATADGWGRQ